MEITNISATELKRKTAEVINMVYYENKEVVVGRFGRALVKITPIKKKEETKKDTNIIANKYFGILPDYPKVTAMRKFRKVDLEL